MTLRRQLQIGVLVVAVLDAALLVWLLSPQAPSRIAVQQQLTLSRAQLSGMRAESAQLSQLNQRLATSREQMQTLIADGFPPQAGASSTLLSEFNRIANLSQVEVSAAEFHPATPASQGLRLVNISLQVSGGYAGVVRFINQLERSPLFFIINQVAVSGGSANARAAATAPANQDLKLELQLEAYVQADAQGRQLGDAPSASGRPLPGSEARPPSDQRERPGQTVASHTGKS